MPDADTTLVRYLRNADNTTGTGALRFNDDDRPDIPIGGVGYVTAAEQSQAAVYGIVLEPISASAARAEGLEVPVSESAEQSLGDLTNAELRQIAADEGADISGKRSNADIAEAIEEHRSAQPVGASSLPATAAPASGGFTSSGPGLGGGAGSGPIGGGAAS